MNRALLATFLLCSACSQRPGITASPGNQAPGDPDVVVEPVLPDGSPAPGTEPPAPVVSSEIITTAHRYVPGAMFGGWGPHLGHLVRINDELVWADDACAPGSCSVNANTRLDYYVQDGGAWTARAHLALPAGVQQNTGSVRRGAKLASYGVDTVGHQIVECQMDPLTWKGGCGVTVAAALPAGSNYVGAAVSPEGWPVTWATTVGDGGGGSFHWFVNYGGGWNGPRSGPIGGYNDSSYINLAFFGATKPGRFVMHSQMVSGLAPNWSYRAAVADGDAASANAVTFVTLGAADKDPMISTNDVLVDPASGDVHVLARTQSGAVAYQHRSAAGVYSPATVVAPKTLRARFILRKDGSLFVVFGGAGVSYSVFPSAAHVAGAPLDFTTAPQTPIALPAGYEKIEAIYPNAAVYDGEAPATVDFALVGETRQNEVLHVAIR